MRKSKNKITGKFENWAVEKEEGKDVIKFDYYPKSSRDLKSEELKISLSDRDWLILSFFKKISDLNESKPEDLIRIKTIEEALHYFTHYVSSIEFTPLRGQDKKFRYKYELNEKAEIPVFTDVKNIEALEGKELINKKIKELIDSPVVNEIIENFIIKPQKNFRLRANKNKQYKVAIHTITQMFGDNKQLSLFSDKVVDDFIRDTGIEINNNRPDSYGVVLNQTQSKVLEAILKAFSDTNYSGDKEIDRDTYSRTEMKAINKIKAYSNINKIPVIKITQAELLELSGYDLKSQRQGDKVDLVEAINFLGSQQFCFYWSRLKIENGKPVKDKKTGIFIKEDVMEVGTILRIKYVKKEKSGDLDYYEIHPSAVLIDQINSYFLLIPNNWREEVKQITGKKASKYTYEFLFWLRLQYERIRLYNKSGGKKRPPKEFKLSKSWEEIAVALKMPETMYKANRKRAEAIIKEAYEVAIKLGYLLKVEDTGATDLLFLNESYYPKPGKLN